MCYFSAHIRSCTPLKEDLRSQITFLKLATDYKLIKFLYQIKKHIAILCNDLLYTFA
jgi:hypothetical protein